MSQFQLFDSIKLKGDVPLSEGGLAPEETLGTIVEILEDGAAYMVELFGSWVRAEVTSDFETGDRNAPDSFLETIAVEIMSPQQIRLVKPARETVGLRKKEWEHHSDPA